MINIWQNLASNYVEWVSANALLSAAIHFAILGSLGEVVAFSLTTKKLSLPCKPHLFLAKMLAWALLGIVIKYGFAGCKGATRALIDQGFLPGFLGAGLGWAFAVSTLTNLFFGPQMMFFHRLEDNIILRERSFAGMERALATLIWFWIPAHTLTFSLPKEYQIGLAAVWSVALGIILGMARAPTDHKASDM
ncbi:hypothetical protein KAI87_15780 [Myxococcota bacterium]|nr:hypothetical protein [Myxococcota bacterium]